MVERLVGVTVWLLGRMTDGLRLAYSVGLNQIPLHPIPQPLPPSLEPALLPLPCHTSPMKG